MLQKNLKKQDKIPSGQPFLIKTQKKGWPQAISSLKYAL